MGMYTNISNTGISSNYKGVKAFVGEHFNYHELGIIAATEMAANSNAFMKAIALNELAVYEQTGSTDVLYESVNIKGIIDKIKMFFKKIIEKFHKILHTFIAKMTSWFGNNESFAKKYEKEVVKKWSNVKNDWSFKGYDFSRAILNSKDASKNFELKTQKLKGSLQNFLNNGDIKSLTSNITNDTELKEFREKIDDMKDGMRETMIDNYKNQNKISLSFDLDKTSGLDQSEYTSELFKLFRNDEDSKIDLDKSAIEKCYNSITGMMTFIKDFNKIKSDIEKSEKNITDGIDKLIKNIEKAEDELIKSNKDAASDKVKENELTVQAASLYQTVWGNISEVVVQFFSAWLQGIKDACSQAKEIAVKVIGQNKNMTESYDYGTSADSGFSFIDSVKLV